MIFSGKIAKSAISLIDIKMKANRYLFDHADLLDIMFGFRFADKYKKYRNMISDENTIGYWEVKYTVWIFWGLISWKSYELVKSKYTNSDDGFKVVKEINKDINKDLICKD